jgi:hypothetical protein
METLEDELDRRRRRRGLGGAELRRRRPEPAQLGHLLHVIRRRHHVGGVHREPAFERLHHIGELRLRERALEDVEDGALHQARQHFLVARFAHGFQLDLAGRGRDDRTEVAHPGHRFLLAETNRPLERTGQQVLVVRDADPHGHARALADVRRLAREVRQLGHDLLHVLRARHAHTAGWERGALGIHDRDLVLEPLRIVRAHLRAEPVLERGDDPPAVRVILRVGARHHVQIERQPHLVAADLHVALLHDVEEADLNALREIG